MKEEFENMSKLILDTILSLGPQKALSAIISAGSKLVSQLRKSYTWKKFFVDTTQRFIIDEKEESEFREDLIRVLSKKNLTEIAKDLKKENGYVLKQRLYEDFMKVMTKHGIPYENAEYYIFQLIHILLEQLSAVAPEKYDQYFLKEWKDEQEKHLLAIQTRLEKVSTDIQIYNSKHLEIHSSGDMDIKLRRSTQNPSIGIEFFQVDDEHFQNEFEDERFEKLVYVRGRSREETIYCILNELWRLNDTRPIYVVTSLQSWNELPTLDIEGSILIPCFYADGIAGIDNNTNIFVLEENDPDFNNIALELRPRTISTIERCLIQAGMDSKKASMLLEDTHGLYLQMKKKLFKGMYYKSPEWLSKLSVKAKQVCLLIGSWEEIEGDKLIIESLYEDSYSRFLEEISPYAQGEDPLLHIIKINGLTRYCLASAENAWCYYQISVDEPIWDSFIRVVLEVINESEKLFTYDSFEGLIAQTKGESLFWSETIRKGMLRTLLIKAAFKTDRNAQDTLDKLVSNILNCVNNEEQWNYISNFWTELCEISPNAVLERLERELYQDQDTGLLTLFRNQTADVLFGRNVYIHILWGIEQFIVQKGYFYRAFKWLLRIDAYNFEYKSNSPKDIFIKVFCTWMNFSALQTAEKKIKAAEIAFEISQKNAWKYIFSSIDTNNRGIMMGVSSPKYREYEKETATTYEEMRKVSRAYLSMLMKHMCYSAERWERILELSSELPNDTRKDIFNQLLKELQQMSDKEVMQVKNKIRYIIYRHRYFASSDWAMKEEAIIEYETLLGRIDIPTPEYEYCYLFTKFNNYSLPHPTPFDKEDRRSSNEESTQLLIHQKLVEFQERSLNVEILAEVCAMEKDTSLGFNLAKSWNGGVWDYGLFKQLLRTQASGDIAFDYLENVEGKTQIPYSSIIADMSSEGFSIAMQAKVYKIEAALTKTVPLVTFASDSIKKEFWKTEVFCNGSNESWAIKECKKYATLEVYLRQIHQIHYKNPLSAEEILECLNGVEKMPHSKNVHHHIGYHLSQLLSVIQEEYMEDVEKCIRISHLEILFMNLIEWENMKCFKFMIKQTPELFADIISKVFKKDHPSDKVNTFNQEYYHNMYSLYDKAQFCPTERDGIVFEDQLEEWLLEYKHLLIQNDQESLFGTTLGRLFSFSPIGVDGYEPCEAVRKMIEKYGDERMISSYQVEVYNRRGAFWASAGREELRLAEDFKMKAEYLEPHFPKTAKIFFGLYESYKRDSERERINAENGLF